MHKNDKEPQYYYSATNSRVLNYRVYVMSASEKLIYTLLLFVAGGAVGLIFYGGLFKSDGVATLATHISNAVIFIGVGCLAIKLFMPVVINMLLNRRAKKLRIQFREFLAALTTSLSSGMNIETSIINARSDLEAQFTKDSYMLAEIDEMISGLRNGIPLESTLDDFGKRSGNMDIYNFSIVFSTCIRKGGNLKQVIARTSDIISEKMAVSDEITTKITSNKMQMNIMNVIPIVIMLMLRVMSSDFTESFASVVGVIAVTISVALFVVSYIIGQKMMDIKE